MDHNHDIHHDNFGMALMSIIISVLGFVATSEITGEIIHWGSIVVGVVIAFVTQKLLHYLWDKYITKKQPK